MLENILLYFADISKCHLATHLEANGVIIEYQAWQVRAIFEYLWLRKNLIVIESFLFNEGFEKQR